MMNRNLLKTLIHKKVQFRRISFTSCLYDSNSNTSPEEKDSVKAKLQEILDPHQSGLSEEEIDKLRNKSHLTVNHQRAMSDTCPVYSDAERTMMSLSEVRSLYGKYGSESQIPYSVLWPSREEMKQLKDLQLAFNNRTPMEALKAQQNYNRIKQETEDKKQADITEKMLHLKSIQNKWYSRAKDQADFTREHLARKKQILKTVREKLGNKIQPTDQVFLSEVSRLESEMRKGKKKNHSKANKKTPVEGTESTVKSEENEDDQ